MSLTRIETARFNVHHVVQDAFDFEGGRYRPLIGLSLVAVLPLMAILLNAAVLYVAFLATLAGFQAEGYERLQQLNGDGEIWASDEA